MEQTSRAPLRVAAKRGFFQHLYLIGANNASRPRGERLQGKIVIGSLTNFIGESMMGSPEFR